MSAIKLRRAHVEDAETVFRMLRALAHHVGEAEEFVSTLEDVRRDGFGTRPCYETIMAEIDARPAGIATFFPIYSTHKGRPCLFVDNLYVESWARGRDIGRLLMGRVCRLAVERNCCRVELAVLHDNPARGFYQAIGMEQGAGVSYAIRELALQELAERG